MAALPDDVARLREVLNRQNGPTIVVGHSYGGQIMTALGTDSRTQLHLFTSPPSASTKANRSALS